MVNALSEKFGVISLIRFTAPTIAMLIFLAMYTMVDGVFVANLINENALSAINIVYPVSSIIVAISIMLATGGSAIIGKQMGEKNEVAARENFTMITVLGAVIGTVFGSLMIFFINPVINLLGATELLYQYCYDYLKLLLIFAPIGVLQMIFQFFFVTAGKPKFGLISTLFGGIANIILDYIFIAKLNMGISGAALATGIGYCIPAFWGIIYFGLSLEQRHLYFTKFKWDLDVILKTCLNGSSEMVVNLATAVTTLLFNLAMVKYLGEDGVAAITIVLYAQFLLTSIFLGFSSGAAPIISYKYGEKNFLELKSIIKICLGFVIVSSAIIFICSVVLADNIVGIFVNKDSYVAEVAVKGFYLFSLNYVFAGFNILVSSIFTALSNGKISATISFLRTFVFIIMAIIVLPKIIGVNGIWLSIPFAEMLTVFVSSYLFYKLSFKE